MSILQALKGIGGGYEINRIVGAAGATAYIVGANAFVWWDVVHLGHSFSITEYCIAFPAGLGVAIGAIAGAVAVKDRNVAKARVTNAEADNASTPPVGDAP